MPKTIDLLDSVNQKFDPGASGMTSNNANAGIIEAYGNVPTHQHVETDITDLDKYTQAEVDGLLNGKADTGHTHPLADITDSGTAASRNVPAAGNAGAAEVVLGSDTRLSDARAPTAHPHTESDILDLNKYTQAEVDALVNAKEDSLGDPPVDDYLLSSKADGTRLWVPPSAGGVTTFLGLTDTPGSYAGESGKYVTVGVDALVFSDAPSGAGEANRGENLDGTDAEIYAGMNGVNITFRELAPASTKVSVTQNINNITFDVVEANINHQSLGGAGTRTHTEIDNHITDTGNPHDTSYTDLLDVPASFPPSAHTHGLVDITDSGTAASRNVPVVGDAGVTEVVLGSDTRLSDSRTPTAHTHVLDDVTDSGTAASRDVPAAGDAGAAEVVLGSDTRLSDARAPTSHTHVLSDVTDSGTAASRNVPAAGDAGATEVVLGSDTRLSDARAPTSHTHTESDITDLDKYTQAQVDAALATKEDGLGNPIADDYILSSKIDGTRLWVPPSGTNLTNAEFPTYAVFFSRVDVAATLVDFSSGNKQQINATTYPNITLTAPTGHPANFVLRILNSNNLVSIAPDAGGEIRWANDTPPSWNGTTTLYLYYDGTDWEGSVNLNLGAAA